MRRRAVLAVLSLALAACASETVATTTTIEQTTSTAGSPGTTAPDGSGTTTTAGTEVDHDRELAPDFTLVLADGGSFTLSEGDKPVYLVFWAEWCPVCRRELPMVDRVAADYGDRVDFIAPAWKSVPEAAVVAAENLFQSGKIRWGLDNDEVVFALYGVPYQPVTVLIAADGTVFDSWAGVRGEEDIRAGLDELLTIPGATG